MLFRNADLLAEFERLTKGLHVGPEFDKAVGGLSTALAPTFTGTSNLDVVRSDDRVDVYFDLPGVDPAQVELTVDGRTLNITAHRDFAAGEGQTLVHAGRRHGTYNRSFKLTEDLDVDQLSARSEHGVLIVSIPVIAPVQPRKIAIEKSSPLRITTSQRTRQHRRPANLDSFAERMRTTRPAQRYSPLGRFAFCIQAGTGKASKSMARIARPMMNKLPNP